MSGDSDSTSYQIKTNAPIAQLESVVSVLRRHPVEHYRHPGLKSNGACCYVEGTNYPESTLEIHFPLPKPTIPDLIAKWHAEPTTANRKALWLRLEELPVVAGMKSGYASGSQTYTVMYGVLGDPMWQIKVC